MMSRKHFCALAKILKANKANDKLIQDVASWLKSQNPRFDSERFYLAAKPESEVQRVCASNVQGASENTREAS